MKKKGSSALLLAAFLLAGSTPRREKIVPSGDKAPSLAVWQIQHEGIEAGLRGVSAISREVAWASGSQGTFLKTTDGGRHWQRGEVPGADQLDFRDIQAFDADRACLLSAGRPAKFYRTDDGGRTWMEAYSLDIEGIFFNAFAFFDDQKGLAFGDPIEGRFMIAATINGGTSWIEIPYEDRPRALKGEAAFAASGTCLSVLGKDEAWFCTGGSSPRVFHSKDAGRTWEAVLSPLDLGTPSAGGFSLAFRDRDNGVMVGGDYKDETGSLKNAAVSHDGGKTWIRVERDQPSGFRECVAFIPRSDPPMIVAVGPSGSDISVDGGATWKPMPGPGFHSLSFSTKDGAGWAVGKRGLIARFDPQAAAKLLKN